MTVEEFAGRLAALEQQVAQLQTQHGDKVLADDQRMANVGRTCNELLQRIDANEQAIEKEVRDRQTSFQEIHDKNNDLASRITDAERKIA